MPDAYIDVLFRLALLLLAAVVWVAGVVMSGQASGNGCRDYRGWRRCTDRKQARAGGVALMTRYQREVLRLSLDRLVGLPLRG